MDPVIEFKFKHKGEKWSPYYPMWTDHPKHAQVRQLLMQGSADLTTTSRTGVKRRYRVKP